MIGRRTSLDGLGEARRTSGFTLVELVMVVTIVSLLAALAQPQLRRVLLRAQAAAAVSELNAVKTAVQQYEGDFLQYPAESGQGQIPPGLETYLPEGFSFTYDDYVMDYDNFIGSGGAFRIGLTVIPNDPTLGQAMRDNSGEAIFELNGKFTWIMIP